MSSRLFVAVVSFSSVLSLIFLAGSLSAQCEFLTLTAGVPVADDRYATSVAVDGRLAVVGSPGTGSGTATIHRLENGVWVVAEELVSPGGSAGDAFGTDLDIWVHRILVGAPGADGAGVDRGAANVFRFDAMTWSEVHTLEASDAVDDDAFGTAVSLDGDVAVVGAPGQDVTTPGDPACDSGAVYLFRFDGTIFAEQVKLVASDGECGDRFGETVAISRETILIGAPGANGAEGAVYVFYFDGATWNETQILTAASPQVGAEFGAAIDTRSGVAVVGAPSVSSPVEVFRHDGGSWQPEALLGPAINALEFGRAVSVHSGRVIVGAPGANGEAGQITVYRRASGAWFEEITYDAPNPQAGARYGDAVAHQGVFAVIGAPDFDTPTSDAGAVALLGLEGVAIETLEPTVLSVPDTGSDLGFSATLASSDDLLVVGAPGDDELGTDTGAVTLYRRGEGAWAFEERLTFAGSQADDGFGSGFGADGAVVAISRKSDTADPGNPGCESGTVELFRHDGTTWAYETTLVPTGVECQDFFGFTFHIGLYGSVVAAAAILDDDLALDAGAVYVYRNTGIAWQFEQKLFAPDGALDDGFSQTSLCGGVLAVGAPRHSELEGAVYIYRFDGSQWNFEAELQASNGFPGQLFGLSPQLHGDVLTVFALDLTQATPGSSYVFRHTSAGWIEEAELVPGPEVQPGDGFGKAGLCQDWIVASARQADAPIEESGIAYFYELDGGAWVRRATYVDPDPDVSGFFGSNLVVGPDGWVLASNNAGPLASGRAHGLPSPRSDCAEVFIRGDANSSGAVDVADAVTVLAYLFSGGTSDCLDAFDTDDNGAITITDALLTLCALFCDDTSAVAAPFPNCGVDGTLDPHDCVSGCP